MTTRKTVDVPEDVLMYLTHSLIIETAEFTLRTWTGPGDVVRMGDPFGKVLTWLWATDPDRAVDMYTNTLHHVRVMSPNATKAITLAEALQGLRLDLPGLGQTGEERHLLQRLAQDVPKLSASDPNATA